MLIGPLTSMVLSLKYLMYSGPMYSGGLQVIKKTGGTQKQQENIRKPLWLHISRVGAQSGAAQKHSVTHEKTGLKGPLVAVATSNGSLMDTTDDNRFSKRPSVETTTTTTKVEVAQLEESQSFHQIQDRISLPLCVCVYLCRASGRAAPSGCPA